ncbi:MAG: hypothetical protein V4725_01190 [Bacteroidota bacterium]|nr:hypothetical protein [Ferruginibacter sp.]
MKSKEKIEEYTDKALNSLDGVERASVSPYLLTRINQKLGAEPATVWEKLIFFIGKPAIAFPALTLILVMNVLAIVSQTSSSTSAADQAASLSADDYSLTVATIYDSENP